MKKTAIVVAALVVFASLLLSGMASGQYDEEFHKAVDLYDAGRYKEALRVLDEYVKERPEAHAYYLMGYANYAMGRRAEAERNFKDAYLVDPAFSPADFRKSIDAYMALKPRPPITRAAKKAVPSAVAPAPSAVAEKPAVAENAPAPAPRPRPAPPAVSKPAVPMAALGLIPLAIVAAIYLLYSLSVFMVGRRLGVGASWLAFVPVVNFAWPLVGAADKSKLWIILVLFIPFVNLYLWMLVADRFGKSKVLGILFGLLSFVPLVNLLFVLLVFKAAAGEGVARERLELPELPEEEAPGLPEAPGMEEKAAFGGAAAEKKEEAPPEMDEFAGLFGEEAPAEEKEAPPAFEEDLLAEAPLGEEFPEAAEEAPEETPAFELDEFEETAGEKAPTIEELGFGEEAAPAEEAVFEEAFGEEVAPGEEAPVEELDEILEEAPLEEAIPEEAASARAAGEAEPWEEPMEYEAAEKEEDWEELPTGAAGAGLMDIGGLFSKTWAAFKRRALTLLLILILSVVITGAAFGIVFGAGMLLGVLVKSMRAGFATGGVVAGAIAAVIAYFWCNGAFVFAVSDERLGVKDAFGQAWRKVGSFIWVSILFTYLLLGGFLLFFIPGVIFAVWFGFALFILAKEDVGGMDAVLKSKEYVKGRFWDVFLRLFVIWALSAAIGFVRFIFELTSALVPLLGPIVGTVVSLVFTPFMMLFMYYVYDDLRRTKGELAFSAGKGQKAKWLGLATLGYVVALIMIALIALAGVALFAKQFQMKF